MIAHRSIAGDDAERADGDETFEKTRLTTNASSKTVAIVVAGNKTWMDYYKLALAAIGAVSNSNQ